MAQVLRKIPPINKMMIIGREAAPEDRQVNRGRIGRNDAIRLRSQEKLLSSSEDEQEQRDNLELYNDDQERRLGRQGDPAETKGKLCRTCMINLARHARPTLRMEARSRKTTTAEACKATHTPVGNARSNV